MSYWYWSLNFIDDRYGLTNFISGGIFCILLPSVNHLWKAIKWVHGTSRVLVHVHLNICKQGSSGCRIIEALKMNSFPLDWYAIRPLMLVTVVETLESDMFIPGTYAFFILLLSWDFFVAGLFFSRNWLAIINFLLNLSLSFVDKNSNILKVLQYFIPFTIINSL